MRVLPGTAAEGPVKRGGLPTVSAGKVMLPVMMPSAAPVSSHLRLKESASPAPFGVAVAVAALVAATASGAVFPRDMPAGPRIAADSSPQNRSMPTSRDFLAAPTRGEFPVIMTCRCGVLNRQQVINTMIRGMYSAHKMDQGKSGQALPVYSTSSTRGLTRALDPEEVRHKTATSVDTAGGFAAGDGDSGFGTQVDQQ